MSTGSVGLAAPGNSGVPEFASVIVASVGNGRNVPGGAGPPHGGVRSPPLKFRPGRMPFPSFLPLLPARPSAVSPFLSPSVSPFLFFLSFFLSAARVFSLRWHRSMSFDRMELLSLISRVLIQNPPTPLSTGFRSARFLFLLGPDYVN